MTPTYVGRRSPTLGELVVQTVQLMGVDRANNRLIALTEELLEQFVAEAKQQNHVDECIKAQLALVQYLAKRPNACLYCCGLGEVDDSDPSVGLYGFAPCPHCVEANACPRCGHVGLQLEDAENYFCLCLKCGWKTGAQSDMPQHECLCWMEVGADEPTWADEYQEGVDEPFAAEDEDPFAYDAWREQQLRGIRGPF